ncbi:MAG: class I SAM-dependent methyltransferase [Flavobacteriales bacterium]
MDSGNTFGYDKLRNTDIYLIDQILKRRYTAGERILDAGAGGGRNLAWFLAHEKEVYAVDQNPESQYQILENYSGKSVKFTQAGLDELPYETDFFDHIICNAVLHFAEGEEHFYKMFNELHRVCKLGGSVFIRTCTSIGLEDDIGESGDGVFQLPDGSHRFLLSRSHLNKLLASQGFKLLEPVKWLNVQDLRVMMTLVLEKTANGKIF